MTEYKLEQKEWNVNDHLIGIFSGEIEQEKERSGKKNRKKCKEKERKNGERENDGEEKVKN